MPQLLRKREAEAFLSQIESPITRRLMEIPYREVLRRFREGDRLPIADFDLNFFVEALYLSCSCHERILLYLDGVDQRWFPWEDEEIQRADYCPLPTREDSGPLVRYHESRWLTYAVADVAVNQIAGVAVAAFTRRLIGAHPVDGEPHLPADSPVSPIDLLFCAEVLLAFAWQKDLIRSILT